TPDDCSASGRRVCSATVAVGRFVPDHFEITSVTPPVFKTFNTDNASCSAAATQRSFTYIGQRFGYLTLPVATVKAVEAGGGSTQSDTGVLWKLSGVSVAQSFANTPSKPLDATGVVAPSLSETPGTGT